MPKPKVFINRIGKELKNNRNSFHFSNEDTVIELPEKGTDVMQKIDELFNSEEFVYKLNAKIFLRDNSIVNEEVIALRDGELITLNGRKIKVEDIRDIKKAN